MSWLASLNVASIWHVAAFLALMWLAFFFGRTLRSGQTPLIERFARVSNPAMSPEFCMYTRWLTGIWCSYFIFAAVVSAATNSAPFSTGLLIWMGTVVLFVGEYRLRPRFFPGQKFPGLLQQIRDTWHVWHSK